MDTPAQSASVFGNDNIVVQASGSGVNVNIGAQPHLRLTRYVNQTKLEIQRDSETAWLSAYRADVVPLVGREDAKDQLKAWLNGDAPVSVRVLVGAGGRGKTRLALEIARDISEEGWLAGFATADNFDRFRRQNGVEDWRWDKPVLVIIDYAASRANQLRAWVRELVDASFDDRPKLRLLLLERQANRAIGWHATVFGSGDDAKSRAANALLDPEEPIELPVLDDLEFRRQVFVTLLKRANGALVAPAKGADPEFDRLLADHKWAGDPLYLMMAGLAAAKAGVRQALSLSRADLALTMGRNELDRIGRIGAARGVDEKHRFPGAFVRHMAATATLLQGVTVVEARKLAAKEIDALSWTADLNATIDALTDALSASDGSGGAAPILPDVIGEAAILAWFGPNGGLATGGIDAASRITAVARTSISNASATLVRIAQDFAGAGYAEPVQWLDALAGAPETDLGALMEIADVLPEDTLSLRAFAEALTSKITKILRNRAEKEAAAGSGFLAQVQLADSLNNLGNRHSQLGQRDLALAASQEATDIYFGLINKGFTRFADSFATSLHNLGGRLTDVGRHEEAATTLQAAIRLRRWLAEARPDVLPYLADSLNTIGIPLSRLGRNGEALELTKESIEICRRLAGASYDDIQPRLGMALKNFAAHLRSLGKEDDALSVALEAKEVYHRLATESSDKYLPEYATCLNNLGPMLSASGRRQEALATAEEAVEIRRRLFGAQPQAFAVDATVSLYNLGFRFAELDRRPEAVQAMHEAVQILSPSFLSLPRAFAEVMNNACQAYIEVASDFGYELDKALLTPIEEAFRRLAAEFSGPPQGGPP